MGGTIPHTRRLNHTSTLPIAKQDDTTHTALTRLCRQQPRRERKHVRCVCLRVLYKKMFYSFGTDLHFYCFCCLPRRQEKNTSDFWFNPVRAASRSRTQTLAWRENRTSHDGIPSQPKKLRPKQFTCARAEKKTLLK